MSYRVDFICFIRHLLPPVLRSKMLFSLLYAWTASIRDLYVRFLAYEEGVSSRMNNTAQVQYLQKVLNDAFFLDDTVIYLDTPKEGRTTVFYYKYEEHDANFFYNIGGNAFYLGQTEINVSKVEDFIVFVPTFICSSLHADDDKYNGENIQKIRDLLAYYKPAGRSYRIELYEYE